MSESSNWKTASLEQWFDIGITLISEQNIQCKNWLIRVYQSFIFLVVVEALLVESVNLDMYTLGQETGKKKKYIFLIHFVLV